MKRGFTVAVVVTVALWGIAAVPAAASMGQGGAASGTESGVVPNAAQTDANETDGNETAANETLPPGARLAGVIGVQQAEIEGEVETRAFGIAFANASSNASKASVVAAQVERLQERLAELRDRREELKRAVENGSMSRGAYAARMAELATETSTVKGLADRSENASRGLPAGLLERKGINASAIQTLKRSAANITGQEVAAIARSIAGPPGGLGVPGGPPTSVGPPDGIPGKNETGLPGESPGQNESVPGGVPGKANGSTSVNATDNESVPDPSSDRGLPREGNSSDSDPIDDTRPGDEKSGSDGGDTTSPAEEDTTEEQANSREGSTDGGNPGERGSK